MQKLRWTHLLPAVFAVACAPPASDDLVGLSITTSGTISVDTVCATDSCPAETVEGEVLIEDHFSVPPDAEVVLQQYKVSYVLAGVGSDVPYFADLMDLTVSGTDPVAFSALVAGSAQRAFVYEQAGTHEAAGTAELTLAGYDWNDDVLTISAQLPVVFGDFTDSSSDTGM